MKKVITFFASMILLSGCDDTFNYIPNTPPRLIINNEQVASASDSVKTSLKHGNNPYEISINVTDKERQKILLSASVKSGSGRLLFGGSPITGAIPTTGSNVTIYFEGLTEGIAVVEIVAEDELNSVTKSTIEFFVFANLTPVASLNVNNTKVEGPFYVVLDASASYDKDKDQGGGIQAFHYTITGTNYNYQITTATEIIPVNLPAPGGYQFLLEVTDNDGGKSTIIKNLTL
jgi:hypothetical protein